MTCIWKPTIKEEEEEEASATSTAVTGTSQGDQAVPLMKSRGHVLLRESGDARGRVGNRRAGSGAVIFASAGHRFKAQVELKDLRQQICSC